MANHEEIADMKDLLFRKFATGLLFLAAVVVSMDANSVLASCETYGSGATPSTLWNYCNDWKNAYDACGTCAGDYNTSESRIRVVLSGEQPDCSIDDGTGLQVSNENTGIWVKVSWNGGSAGMNIYFENQCVAGNECHSACTSGNCKCKYTTCPWDGSHHVCEFMDVQNTNGYCDPNTSPSNRCGCEIWDQEDVPISPGFDTGAACSLPGTQDNCDIPTEDCETDDNSALWCAMPSFWTWPVVDITEISFDGTNWLVLSPSINIDCSEWDYGPSVCSSNPLCRP